MRTRAYDQLEFGLMTLLGVGLLVAGAGCSDSGKTLAPVRGKVLLDGKPMTSGQVLTQPKAGRGSNGAIQLDGSFELTTGNEPGALAGSHQVSVVAYENGASTSPEASLGKLLVPQRYTSGETSGLTIEVDSSGNNEPVLELKSGK